MKKVNCSICKKEIEVKSYRLKTTKNFYCFDHKKDGQKISLQIGRGWMKGKHHTEETKRKCSESGKKRIFTKEQWDRMLKGLEKGHGWNKGIPLSLEARKHLSEIQMGKKINNNQRRGLEVGRINRKGQKASEKTREKLRLSHLGHKMSNTTKMKKSKFMKKLWENDKAYRKQVLGRRNMSSLEVRVNNLINKNNLPYKFVGNGKFFIERKNPDFINVNGEKIAIEVFWKKHKEQFNNKNFEEWEKEREKIFKKYGWKIIFIEGSNITNNEIIEIIKKGGD